MVKLLVAASRCQKLVLPRPKPLALTRFKGAATTVSVAISLRKVQKKKAWQQEAGFKDKEEETHQAHGPFDNYVPCLITEENDCTSPEHHQDEGQ